MWETGGSDLAVIIPLDLTVGHASAYRDIERGVFLYRDPAGMVDGARVSFN